MGVKNAPKIAAAIIAAGRAPETPAIVIQEGATTNQRGYRCTLGTLAETMKTHNIQPPAVYVIGDVAGLSTISLSSEEPASS